MSGLVIWGAGGHGKVVLEVARAMGVFPRIAFLDDAASPGLEFRGCPCLPPGSLASLREQGYGQILVAIGDNTVRAARFEQAMDAGYEGALVIHSSAVISPSARIGPGTVVMPGVVVNADAEVGQDVILNTAAVVEHDCTIGSHAHLSPGVVLGGGVAVGRLAHLGLGAVALPGAAIGEAARVGAGAVVLDRVADGVTVVGVPAKEVNRR